MCYSDRFTDRGEESFKGYSPQEIAEDYTKGFNIELRTTNYQQLKIYPTSYELTQPDYTKARTGAGAWAFPSKVQAVAKAPKYPVDLTLQPDPKVYFLTSTADKYAYGTGEKYHKYDPDNKVMSYDPNTLPAWNDSQVGFDTFKKGWIWGIDFKSYFRRVAHTYVHYTELNNIKVDNYPEPVIQQAWKYPWEWHFSRLLW